MKKSYPFLAAPRCTAMSKRTGQRCRAPAVRGWRVCRFHGARGGGPKGERNGAYKHGLHTKEAVVLRREIRALLRTARAGVEAVREGTRATTRAC